MEFHYIFVVMDEAGKKHLVSSPKSASVGDLVRFNGGITATVKAEMFSSKDELSFLKEYDQVHNAESIFSCVYDQKENEQ